MSGEFADLFVDKALARRVLAQFQRVIGASFAQDGGRTTQSETTRRFRLAETIFRDLRALGWAHQRILDELPRALRARIDGEHWEPDTRRNTWTSDA